MIVNEQLLLASNHFVHIGATVALFRTNAGAKIVLRVIRLSSQNIEQGHHRHDDRIVTKGRTQVSLRSLQ